MATLVLTTVGQVAGGPIGGALGALAGQAIDARLFRGAAHEGPRLTELAVQTSSYGTQIPKLFGTIRVAGTVIWSTDLIETRATARGGKGQAGTTTYSYSASFAVALSARPIRAVRRIWAEGKLLRGAGGDWKVRTGFRLHAGGEDQAVDPLIASAMGVTPAYRGIAYAVFEGLPLADYGNRIPSLTFEVEADAGPVTSGAIAAALADDVSAAGGVPLHGFAAAGTSLRGVLDTLTALDGGWWRPAGLRLVRGADDGAATAIVDAGIGGGGRQRTLAPPAGIAREVAVAHHDPARDYQIGVQRVRRPGAGDRIERVELPAVMPAAAAKAAAAALLARSEAGRERRRATLGIEGLGIAPGTIVALAGEAGRWRVDASSVTGMATTLDLVALGLPPGAMPASSGSVVAAPDRPAGATIVVAAELPAPVPLATPRVSVVATGTGAGWRGASLLYSLDDGASWEAGGATAAPAVIGRIDTVPAIASPGIADRSSRIVVTLTRGDMTLADADTVGLGQLGNLALVGDELIQFARAEPLGAGRWALGDLRRGLRGTEAAIGSQRVGARFVLLERDAVAAIDLPATAIGRRVRILASGVGDTGAPAEVAILVTGASVAPPSPVHLAMRTGAGGALVLDWVRRSRGGWDWVDGIDAPLAEEAEAYRVVLDLADGTRRTVASAAPQLTIARDGLPPGRIGVAVVQQGTIAASAAATRIFDPPASSTWE
jgi:hypothetical protein